jgi:hypothetical protein
MRKSLTAMGLALLLAACSQRPPTLIDAAGVEPQLYWSRTLDHQRIALDGYINFDNGPGGQAIAVGPELRSAPGGGGDRLIGFNAPFGAGPNQIGSPDLHTHPMFANAPHGVPEVVTFDPATLTWRDAAGAPHPLSQRVRLVGEVGYALSVEPDPRAPNGQRFTPFLTDVELTPAPP